MQQALVQGHATSTVKHPSLNGQRLLLAQTTDNKGKPDGDPILVLDKLGAGVGDRIIVTSDGRGLRELLGSGNSPARWWTLGIVDGEVGN